MDDNGLVNLFLASYGLSSSEFEPLGGGLSSFTLLVKTSDGKRVMKIADKDSNLATEINLGNYLYLQGIPTAKVIKNKEGGITTYIDDSIGALFGFCDGEPITWGNLSEGFSKNTAGLIAKMHLTMLESVDISAKDYSGCNLYSLDGVTNKKIAEQYELIASDVRDIDFSGMRRVLIHGDLTRKNILIGDDRKTVSAVIDFGDAHYDFIVWDLAVMITHVFITKTYGIDREALKIFFEEYNRLLPLSRKEKNAIIPFIKARNINLAIEVNRTKKTEENAEELLSIENSVITKLNLIQEAKEELKNIFN